jgi:8-hydroxy-5-deazaflavin:NADPH oxidoreductase
MKKIGIIGSGAVGITLAKGFAQHGHQVMIGTNNAGKQADLHTQTGVPTGTFEETARFGESILLAVKGVAAESVVREILPHLSGKTVMDAVNPIAEAPPVNGVLQFFTDINLSLMERLQALAPAAHFVKVFNSVGNGVMVNPAFNGTLPTLFICGNDEAAKAEVQEILDRFGWETADMGKAESARAIEPLCMLWCIPGFLQNQWTHAFKLLKS